MSRMTTPNIPRPGQRVGGPPQPPQANPAQQAAAQATSNAPHPPAPQQAGVQVSPDEQATATPVKRKALERIDYPGLKDASGNPVKLPAWPADWKPSKHKPFKIGDFESSAVYYNGMADIFERRAGDYRRRANDAQRLGGIADQKKAKKFMDARARLLRLSKELEAEGADMEALLALADEGDQTQGQ